MYGVYISKRADDQPGGVVLLKKQIFEQIDLCVVASALFRLGKRLVSPAGLWDMAGALIIRHIRQHNPGVHIVLDPVIRASSGKEFWGGVGDRPVGKKDRDWMTVGEERIGDRRAVEDEWAAVAARCYLLTPNWEEIGWLYPEETYRRAVPGVDRTDLAAKPAYLSEGRSSSRPAGQGLFV